MKPKVAFFGSPAFALPVLEAIRTQFEIVLVVTQPSKPAGRGLKLTPPAIAARALELGLPLDQPVKLRKNTVFENVLRSSGAVVAITCAYGKILPQSILEIPAHGFLNVHTSLLPKYRGAAPIQWAMINGETQTGVTIMKTDVGMDTGNIALVGTLEIDTAETSLELAPRLSALGADLIVKALANLEQLSFTPQNHELATHARMITKEDGRIDWSKSSTSSFNWFRGLAGWPGSFAFYDSKLLKVHAMQPTSGVGNPGEILRLETGVVVATANGALELLEVQPEGKAKLSALDWAKGYQIKIGTILS